MGQKKNKKMKLKWRILRKIAIVLTVSMLLGAIVGYLYFEQVVRRQKIADEQAKQEQLASQIEFMTDDIQNFAKSVIIDETLQDAINERDFQNEFERIKNTDLIAGRLSFYNSLRTYIASTFLELEDGRRFSSSYGSSEEDYIERKFGVDEFKSYVNHPEWKYSNPYIGLESRATSPVICLRREIWSEEQFGTLQGTLYIEVYLDQFIRQIENYGSQYENVCIIGNEQEILYRQDTKERITEYLDEHDIGEDGVYKAKDGYLICKKIEENGWTLCTLVTRQYLWSQSRFVLTFFLLSFTLSLSLILISTSRILEKTILPITRLSESMARVQYDKIKIGEIVHTGDEIQTLYECYQTMLQEIHRGIEERITYEKQKKEMQFDIMLSQINPHYLYNVLNTIMYLAAAEKNHNIVKITNSLIYTLQETLNLGEHQIETSIEKEWELTRCYLDIQKYRYPDMFQVKFLCEEELMKCSILKTSLQPLVENALLHGILPTERNGIITITVSDAEGNLVVCVKDDGAGIDDDMLKRFREKEIIRHEEGDRKHIGISNIRDRIGYLYGEPYGMEINQLEAGGTEVKLMLPLRRESEESAQKSE